MRSFKHIISGLIFALLLFDTQAQTTTIEGILKEEGSGEPIEFAHVLIKGLNIGTTTDTAGFFNLKVKEQLRSLAFSKQ